jgi:glucose-1-phosphatase
MKVKNIIFDLGGVILDIDYQRTETAFRALGCQHFNEIYSQARQTSLFDDFERGEIDEAAFFYKLRNLAGLNVTQKQLKDAWNAMLIGLPPGHVEMLSRLGKKYRLFLLSNTNETHINAFSRLVEQVCPIGDFESLFEKIYYSNYIGLKKPHVSPFLKIMIENELSAHETLFIDDSLQHVKGAVRAGLHARLLERGQRTEALLRELNLL